MWSTLTFLSILLTIFIDLVELQGRVTGDGLHLWLYVVIGMWGLVGAWVCFCACVCVHGNKHTYTYTHPPTYMYIQHTYTLIQHTYTLIQHTYIHTHTPQRVLATRIEEALREGRSLDELSADRHVLPPNMRYVDVLCGYFGVCVVCVVV